MCLRGLVDIFRAIYKEIKMGQTIDPKEAEKGYERFRVELGWGKLENGIVER